MRIIGGTLKRKKLATPKDASTTRPMPDHVREAVFNLLRGHPEEGEVVDVFAGTGAIGLEAISRGATRCVFVERDRGIARLIETNIGSLGVSDRCSVVVGDALAPGVLGRCPERPHLVFFDPPYPIVWDPTGWDRVRAQFARFIERLTPTGYAVIRTPWPFLHGPKKTKNVGHTLDAKTEAELEAFERALFGGGADEQVRVSHREGREMLDPAEPSEGEGPSAEDAVEADLTIAGAMGPETHVYGRTAVHLYMRAADPAEGA